MSFWMNFLYDVCVIFVVPSILIMYCVFLGNKYGEKFKEKNKDKISRLSKKEKSKYFALKWITTLISILIGVKCVELISGICTNSILQFIITFLVALCILSFYVPFVTKYSILSDDKDSKDKSNNIKEN